MKPQIESDIVSIKKIVNYPFESIKPHAHRNAKGDWFYSMQISINRKEQNSYSIAIKCSTVRENSKDDEYMTCETATVFNILNPTINFDHFISTQIFPRALIEYFQTNELVSTAYENHYSVLQSTAFATKYHHQLPLKFTTQALKDYTKLAFHNYLDKRIIDLSSEDGLTPLQPLLETREMHSEV